MKACKLVGRDRHLAEDAAFVQRGFSLCFKPEGSLHCSLSELLTDPSVKLSSEECIQI